VKIGTLVDPVICGHWKRSRSVEVCLVEVCCLVVLTVVTIVFSGATVGSGVVGVWCFRWPYSAPPCSRETRGRGLPSEWN